MQESPSSFIDSFSDQLRASPRMALLACALLYMVSLAVLVPIFLLGLGRGFGLAAEEMQLLLSGDFSVDPEGKMIYQLAQIGHQLLSWGVIAGIMIWLLGRNGLQWAARSEQLRWHIILAALFLVSSIPLVQLMYLRPEWVDLPGFLSDWEHWMEVAELQVQESLSVILGSASAWALLGNLVVFALLPAICEELVFRGILLKQLDQLTSQNWAILISAALFSFVHFQFYGFFVRLLLGVILAIFVVRSGSLLPSIIAHFAFNAATVLLAWLSANTDWISVDVSGASGELSWPVFFLSLGLSVIVGYLYYRLPLPKMTPS